MPYWAGNLTSIYSLGDFNNKFDIESLSISDPLEDLKLDKAIENFNKKF